MRRYKAFYAGFLIGLFLFALVNIYSYDRMHDQDCFDCIRSFGLPLRFYETGTIHHLTRILWDGLIADILIAISVSIGIGLISRRLSNIGKSFVKSN